MARLALGAFLFCLATATLTSSQEAPLTASCKRHAQCSTPQGDGYCWRTTCYPFYRFPFPITIDTVKQQVDAFALSKNERVQILSLVSNVIADINVHLSLYRNVYNFDPLSRLARLIAAQTDEASAYDFHQNVSRTFRKMNDFHSLYEAPPPLIALMGLLGFSIDRYYEDADESNSHFIVTDTVPGFKFSNPSFKRGVTITHIDSVPVHRAAIRAGRAGYASNAAAVLSLGTDALTSRPAIISDLPEKTEAKIRYMTEGNHPHTIRVPWQIVSLDKNLTTVSRTTHEPVPAALRQLHKQIGISRNGQKRATDFPPLAFLARMSAPALRAIDTKEIQIPVKSEFVRLFSACVVETTSGKVGVLKLPAFGDRASVELVAELTRILKLMPSRGLIVDLRGNQGGSPDFPKALTELFSDKKIPALPMQMRASRFFLAAFNIPNPSDILQIFRDTFKAALDHALQVGERMTGPVGDVLGFGTESPFPKQDRVYFGPVITLTDARVYSAGDLFTLLQKDVGTSVVVGVDNTTGAGGAAGFSYMDVQESVPDSLKVPLPGGVDFSVSALRFFRTGAESGAQVEHFGVPPDIRYLRTKNDLLNNDEDLFNFLASRLVSKD